MRALCRMVVVSSIFAVAFLTGCGPTGPEAIDDSAPVEETLPAPATIPVPGTASTDASLAASVSPAMPFTVTPVTPLVTVPAPGYKITMDERVFDPIKLTVPAGAEVEFQSFNHVETRIYCDYPFEAAVPALKSFYYIFARPGVYKVWEETLPLDTVTITVLG